MNSLSVSWSMVIPEKAAPVTGIVLATEETTVTQQVSPSLSNANPACGHKEVRRSTGHIMVTTRYSANRDPNRDKKLCGSTSNGTDQYQNGSSNLLTPYREQSRSTRNVVAYPRPAFSAKTGNQPVLINKSKFLKATHFVQK